MRRRPRFRGPKFRGQSTQLPPEKQCPNCGTPVDNRYCPSCGQQNEKRLASVRVMVRDALEDELSLDAKVPRTLVGLLFRPGFLTREYLRGRVARYVLPFRLYLIASLLFFVVLPFIADFDRMWGAIGPNMEAAARGQSITGTPGGGAGDEIDRNGPALREESSAPGAEGFALIRSGIDTTAIPRLLRPLAGYYVRQEAKINAMSPREGTRVLYEETTENVPRVIFLLLPAFAFFLKTLYWRRLYAEHFVFALHFHAFLFLLATVALVAQSLGVLQLLVLAVLVYLFAALKRVYQQSWLRTAAKYVVLLFVYNIAFSFAIGSVIFLIVLTA